MLLKQLFQASAIDDFAKELGRDFSDKFPPSLIGQPDKNSAKKLAQAAAELCQKAYRYQQEHKLGLYKKARLSNTLKWELKEQGYNDDLVNELVKRMLFTLAQKRKD